MGVSWGVLVGCMDEWVWGEWGTERVGGGLGVGGGGTEGRTPEE